MINKKCVICRQPLPMAGEGGRRPTKYCCQRCRSLSRVRKYRASNPKSHLSTSTVGAIGEYRVIVDLLTRGYHVFRAVSPTCCCDLAILKDDKLLRVEVTTGKITLGGKIFYPSHNPADYDIIAAVLPDRLYYFPDLPT